MKKSLLTLMVIVTICFKSFAQNDTLKDIANATNAQKTANTKDILSTFFRAGIDNLLGDKHSYNLSSTFYGIDSIFKKKGNPRSYKTERLLRQNSFNLGITGDSSNNITKLTGGFTFTILNKKDIESKSMDAADLSKLQGISMFMNTLKRSILDYIAAKHAAEYDNIIQAVQASWTKANKDNDYSKLHPYILEALSDTQLSSAVVTSSPYSENEIKGFINSLEQGKNPLYILFKSIGQKYARKPLWTFSPTATYDRIHKQGEYAFASDFTVGIAKKDLSTQPWELEIKSLFTIANDTAIKASNYDNKLLSVSLGVNKVLLENEDKESKMEFKLFTQFDHQFGNTPIGTETNVFTFNSTLRVNVYKSLWLPVTVKYDPESGNVFGMFSITANLGK